MEGNTPDEGPIALAGRTITTTTPHSSLSIIVAVAVRCLSSVLPSRPFVPRPNRGSQSKEISPSCDTYLTRPEKCTVSATAGCFPLTETLVTACLTSEREPIVAIFGAIRVHTTTTPGIKSGDYLVLCYRKATSDKGKLAPTICR